MINDCEHRLRGGSKSEVDYVITRPEQKLPKDVRTPLRQDSYKKSLMIFLAAVWQKPIYAQQMEGPMLYFGIDSKVWAYKSNGYYIARREVSELKCHREGTDTKIV